MKLVGARVLLTGASGGLGEAIARLLARRGASLVLTGRRMEVLEPLAAELGARAVRCDLADRGDVEALAAGAGDVDVLVANAGIPGGGDLLRVDVDTIDRTLDVNLRSPIVLARRLGEGMAARGRGHIVFVNSLNGKAASPGTAMYSATKFGLRGFALGLREDLRPRGVGVSTVFPGFVRDAGMFAASGVKLPFYVGTSTPAQVAEAVAAAIERDTSERSVAPLPLRVGALIAGIAPELSARVQGRLGAATISQRTTSGQERAGKR